MSHTPDRFDHDRHDEDAPLRSDLDAPPLDVADGGTGHTAGAFDIRNIIGALLGIYGLLLLIAGFVGDQALDKTGGVNANLWTGLALLAAGLSFMAWAKLKPIVVPDHLELDPDRPVGH
ncbi:hypothetical protein ACQP1U_03210 [Actinomycetota bacterium]